VRTLHHGALQEWQGGYYAFDGRQVRVVDVGRTPWVVDVDAFVSLGIERVARTRELLKRTFDVIEYAPIPGTQVWGFSEAGLRKYLANRQDVRARKFRLWAEREVYFPWYRRDERPATER
jgi:prophage antirepressor-like protein